MSTQRPSGSIDADRALDDLLDAAAASPDDEPRHHADFAAVLARAHRIDPTAMPARPTVDAAGRTPPRRADVDRVLASLVSAARDDAERDVTAEATRIGISCRLCPRTDCDQRAFPPADRTIRIDPDRREVVPYRVT